MYVPGGMANASLGAPGLMAYGYPSPGIDPIFLRSAAASSFDIQSLLGYSAGIGTNINVGPKPSTMGLPPAILGMPFMGGGGAPTPGVGSPVFPGQIPGGPGSNFAGGALQSGFQTGGMNPAALAAMGQPATPVAQALGAGFGGGIGAMGGLGGGIGAAGLGAAGMGGLGSIAGGINPMAINPLANLGPLGGGPNDPLIALLQQGGGGAAQGGLGGLGALGGAGGGQQNQDAGMMQMLMMFMQLLGGGEGGGLAGLLGGGDNNREQANARNTRTADGNNRENRNNNNRNARNNDNRNVRDGDKVADQARGERRNNDRDNTNG